MPDRIEIALRIVEAYGRRPFASEPPTSTQEAEVKLYDAAVHVLTEKLKPAPEPK